MKTIAFYLPLSKDGPMKRIWDQRYRELESAHLARSMRITGPGPVVETRDGPKIIFCSNDYLGLAVHPHVIRAAAEGMAAGVGAGASRLVSGNETWHDTLERAFAEFTQQEAAVLFPSGYQANVGTISALAHEGDVIFSDERSHASIIDGCRLSKARVEIYSHNNVDDLRQRLERHRGASGGRLVVCEAIYSMDGDVSPLAQICDAAAEFGAAVYLDEAHSIGVLGPEGRGLAAQLNVANRVDILVGTFGKAVGVSGAAVACSETVSRLIKSSARSLLYTTAPPSALARAVCESLSLIRFDDELRHRLDSNVQYFRSAAKAAKISLSSSTTPIQPVVIGDAARTMEMSNRLWERGLFVQGIRPPTVAPGTERLRITITARHCEAHIERLVAQLAALGAGQ